MSDKLDRNKLELKPIPDGFEIDVASWKMKRYKAWNNAAVNVDIDKLNEFMAAAIIKTPYPDFNPRNAENFDEVLDPRQWKDCVEAVGNALYNCFLA